MREITHLVARFREAGLKITPQRLSICHLLKDDRTHPSAEEIYHKALEIHPSISFTTVYKTLQTLRELGEIQELNVDPERVHYDPEVRDHAHFFCQSCKSLVDLEMDPLNAWMMADLFPQVEDMEVHHTQIHMVGLCPKCRDKKPEA
ncbi:MAG: transcriptional repressor [Proteobacteria bacterium]|nr:transcriptional repressor [Pseudomonadota bacterium]